MARASARKRPTVTAVIPAFNMEAFLERTLASAIGQTYPDLEIIVVDDGSTDETRAVAERVAATHDRIRVESTVNSGVAGARNCGIQLARSTYVAFLDGDDLWHPEKIEKQVAALSVEGHCGTLAACYTLFRFVGVTDRVLGNGPVVGASGAFFEKHLYLNHVGNGSSLLVRRDAALAVGGFDSGYAERGIGGLEDYEFQLKLLQHFSIGLVGEFLVGYRFRKGQMSEDMGRMSKARIATIEAVLADCDLPPPKRSQALAHARVIAAYREALAGDLLTSGKIFARSIADSPRLTARWIVELARLRLGHMRAGQRAGQPEQKPEASLPFFDQLAPTDGLADENAVSIPRRARLAQFRARPADQPAGGEAKAGGTASGRPARSAR